MNEISSEFRELEERQEDAVTTTRTRVSVIGLGNLGSAMAGALLRGGSDVTVWNRTPGRIDPLVEQGAVASSTLEEALKSAEVVIFALPTYAVIDHVFDTAIESGWLAGRAVVNIGTGDAAQARVARDKFVAGGAEYLDGDCGSYPSAIGGERSLIIYSGPRELFDRLNDGVIVPLGTDGAWVGEDIGAANSLYMATTAFFLTSVVAFFEGAAHADHHDISANAYANYSAKYLDTVRELITSSAPLMEAHNHAGIGQAALEAYLDASRTVEADAEGAGARTDLLSVTTRSFEAGVRAGHGASEVSVLFELLRDRSMHDAGASRKKRFGRQMEALGRGDVDGVLEHFSDDVQYVEMNDVENPVRGKDAIRDWITTFLATFADLDVRIMSMTSEGDRLVAEVEINATYTGDDFGLDAKGRAVVLRLSLVDMFDADGLIVQERAYSDPAQVATQLTGTLVDRPAS